MPDERSLGEISRTIEDFRREVSDDFTRISQQLTQFVPREVYAADEATRNLRFGTIEGELKRRSSNQVLMVTLLITAFLGPIIVGVVVFLVTKSLK